MFDLIQSLAAVGSDPPSLLSPASASDLAGQGGGLLVVACMVLGFVAILVVAGIAHVRREARKVARRARDRTRTIGALLKAVRLAQTASDLGVWQY